jgi:hypothetical protein
MAEEAPQLRHFDRGGNSRFQKKIRAGSTVQPEFNHASR